MWLSRENDGKYDALIFDFRGVLYLKTKKDRHAFFSFVHEELGMTPKVLKERLPGLTSRLEPSAVLEVLEATFECPTMAQKLRQAPGLRRSVPIEENLALVRALSRSYRIGLLANSDGTVEARLAGLGMRPYFDSVVDSHVVGMRKPDTSVYVLAARDLDTEVRRCVFIDDRIENVEAARRAGMTGVHFCHERGDNLAEQLERLGVSARLPRQVLANVS